MPLIEINQLRVTYVSEHKRTAAVRGVTLTVNEQESVGIVGESGSGKSTLALAILRLLPHNTAHVEGEIRFLGNNLLELSEERMTELRWQKLSVVFQKSMNALSPVHKIGQQMSDVFRIHVKDQSKQEVKERMIQLLEMVGLPPRVYDMYPHELSGGMMQRVSIALSLMHHPKLLILDEATTALDVITQRQILDELMELERQLQVTRIMITHDIATVAYACHKVAVMYAGQIVEFGDVSDVLREPQHPYTQALMRTIPAQPRETAIVRGIPGSIPDLSEPIRGCAFADRCSLARNICRNEEPPQITMPGGSQVQCHLAGGVKHAG